MNRAILLVSVLILSSCNTGNADKWDENFDEASNQKKFIKELLEEDEKARKKVEILSRQLEEREMELRISKQYARMLTEKIRILSEKKELPPSTENILGSEDVVFLRDKVILNVPNAFGAIFSDTKSMEPLMNKHTFAIQVPSEHVRVGDIIAFYTNRTENIISHRVIAIGEDESGWFAIAKGDNNPVPDPGKIRKKDIIGVTIGIIY